MCTSLAHFCALGIHEVDMWQSKPKRIKLIHFIQVFHLIRCIGFKIKSDQAGMELRNSCSIVLYSQRDTSVRKALNSFLFMDQ